MTRIANPYPRPPPPSHAQWGVERDINVAGLEDGHFRHRGLFWARLECSGLPGPRNCVFVATAHLPWEGCREECETGRNPRVGSCVLIRRHLQVCTSVCVMCTYVRCVKAVMTRCSP